MPLEDRRFILSEPAADAFQIYDNTDSADAPNLRIALVGTYAPRQCGIATFCGDVVEQVTRFHRDVGFDIYALDRAASPLDYAQAARALDDSDPAAYAAAADAINGSGADAVWLHHEYGIFGGPDGELVCDFVDRLAPPLLLTLHTVLTEPNERQRAILCHLIDRASRIMVMSRHSHDVLAEQYSAPRDLIKVVEHGAPDRPFGREPQFKAKLGLGDRPVLMTFGLLGPGKGLEQVIEALPAILARHPRALYRIVGATHPNLVAEQGEAYRDSLVAQAERLGVANAIAWENRFLDTPELLDQLEACDIYVTPYHNLQQSTSGTLSYAVALGKAVVSTPYIHATELLADGVGMLIEPDCADAIAGAVIDLLDDRERLARMKRAAWDRGRATIWPRFAAAGRRLVEEIVPRGRASASLAADPSAAALRAMIDDTGMLQHAIGIVPDRHHGYCLDDTVRALMLLEQTPADPWQRNAAVVCASFLQHAWNPAERRFRNFMRFDRQWCESRGSDDSNGRALWALGTVIACTPDPDMRAWARRWYDTALEPLAETRSPRARAFVMLGAAARVRNEADHGISRDVLEDGADFLLGELAAARAPRDHPDWTWFERRLGYDNARLAQALLEAGEVLGREDALAAGLETLAWLAARETAPDGRFRPIGSAGFGRDYESVPFDQQPLEAHAAIDAARVALRVSGKWRWSAHADRAWQWFFGGNDRGAVLADVGTGLCRDGLNPRGANANCGAESILAFHLAYRSMIAIRQDRRESTGDGVEPDKRLREHAVSHF